MTFTALAILAILIGGLVEIIPMYLVKQNVPTIASVKPYTPLEVIGRDIYIREGCVGCHSQMVRPFRSETERFLLASGGLHSCLGLVIQGLANLN